MLRIGYINISDFVKAGERMVNIFTALPWLKPFDMLGTNDERTLNEKAMAIVQDYSMYGHFLDIKQAYVIGMLKALQDYDVSRGVPFIVYKEYALDMTREKLYAETDKRMR